MIIFLCIFFLDLKYYPTPMYFKLHCSEYLKKQLIFSIYVTATYTQLHGPQSRPETAKKCHCE